MQNRLIFLGLTVLGLGAACGKSDGNQHTGGAGTASVGANTPLDQFATVYATAACNLLDRCWKTALIGLNESCQDFYQDAFQEQEFSNILAAVQAGTVQYHPEELPACLADFDSTPCDATALPDCFSVFTGNKAAGDDCTLAQECGANLQCLSSGTCPGKCAPLAALNDACGAGNDCAHDLSCLESAQAGKCVTPATEGSPCSATAPCVGFLDCLGLDRTDPQSTGTCQNRDAFFSGAENQACSISGVRRLCQVGLSCVLDTTTTGKGTCQAALAADAACQQAFPEQCPSGQYCLLPETDTTAAGKCTDDPKLGEPCKISLGSSNVCSAGQFCHPTTKVCAVKVHLGEACSVDGECLSATCSADGKCIYPLECAPPT